MKTIDTGSLKFSLTAWRRTWMDFC
jgi:hypothetical protein